jgi:molecular chaperone DnaJ
VKAVRYTRDYYEVLGVHRNVPQVDIRKAYKKLAMKYHPDKVRDLNREAVENRFKEINEAYSVLSDQTKRRIYDSGGHRALQGGFNSNRYHTTTYSNFNGKSKREGILQKVHQNGRSVILEFAIELNVDVRNLIKILELMILKRVIRGKIEAGLFIRS